jgi:hypothetical protein
VAGYAEGLDLLISFFLLVSGGNEKETFWFLNSVLMMTQHIVPFDGLVGLFDG